MSLERDKAHTVIGLAVYFGFITGIASLAVATFSFFDHEWVAAGICFAAAALAFGLIANAVLRH